LSSYELRPYRITERGIRRLGRPEETAFRKKLDHISKPLASPTGVSEAWQAYLAYYGPAGFKKEVLGILDKMETEPRKARPCSATASRLSSTSSFGGTP